MSRKPLLDPSLEGPGRRQLDEGRRRRSGRGAPALAVLLILAAMPRPSAAAEDPTPEEVGKATVSRIALAGGGGGPVLVLRRPVEPPVTDLEAGRGLLAREVVRQAVLIAARDGLGLPARDAVLGDAGDGEVIAEVAAEFRKGGGGVVVIRRLRGSGRQALLDRELPGGAGGAADFPALVAAAERLARVELPAALGRAGFAGRPNRAPGAAPAPEGVEERLGTMTPFAQFAAMRAVHEAIRDTGESPARLGALARAYANLGVLAEPHWDASHKVFKARALLYAERLVAAAPDSASALQHRAYARALAGLPGAALADLEAARAAKDAGHGEAPAWVGSIEAYARCDAEHLAGGEPATLATLLQFFAAERASADINPLRSTTSNVSIIKAGVAAEAANPECLRVLDGLAEVRDLGIQQDATGRAPQLLSATIARRLADLPGLPEGVAPLATQPEDEPKVVAALVAAGRPGKDAGEPSWAVLGRLIREDRFAATYRRVRFMAEMWSVPVGDYLEEVRPMVAGHPYHDFLRCYGIGDRDELARTIKGVHIADLEKTEYQYLMKVMPVDSDTSAWQYAALQGHEEALDRDLVFMICYAPEERRAELARRLREVSPHSPFGVAALVEYDWDAARPQAEGWEREFGRDPPVLGALARRYVIIDRPDDARRCLRAYIRVAPDQWAYIALADVARAKGDDAGWKAALEEYLEQPTTGLGHAQVRARIARYYMDRQEWKLARPYADAAAESGAAWAMLCAARCYEGLREWREAEAWVRRTAERYDSKKFDWFLWCARTHHGDARAAIRLATDGYADRIERLTPDELDALGTRYLLEGEPRKALDAYHKSYLKADKPLGAAFDVALLAADLREAGLRDELLKQVAEDPRYEGKKMPRIAALFRKSLDQAPDHPLDLKAVDELIEQMPEAPRGDASWMVARFLEYLGRTDEAPRYYKACAGSITSSAPHLILSAESLRKRGIEPPSIIVDEGKQKPAAKSP